MIYDDDDDDDDDDNMISTVIGHASVCCYCLTKKLSTIYCFVFKVNDIIE